MFLYLLFFTLYLEIDFHTKNTLFFLQYNLLVIQYNKLKTTKTIKKYYRKSEREGEGGERKRERRVEYSRYTLLTFFVHEYFITPKLFQVTYISVLRTVLAQLHVLNILNSFELFSNFFNS